MNSQPKILLIDNAPDRKERINILKARGYSVFPALRMEEARSRCLRGGYDLIVVNAGDLHDQALQYCDDIRKQCPRQLLIMTSDTDSGRDYAIPADLQSLVNAVDRALSVPVSDYASAA